MAQAKGTISMSADSKTRASVSENRKAVLPLGRRSTRYGEDPAPGKLRCPISGIFVQSRRKSLDRIHPLYGGRKRFRGKLASIVEETPQEGLTAGKAALSRPARETTRGRQGYSS